MGPLMQAELLRQRSLEVEQQPVLAPSREMMQADTHRLEKLFVLLDLPGLGLGNYSAMREVAPGLSDAGRARDPEDGLEVAKAARAFLDVRLEIGFGVAH